MQIAWPITTCYLIARKVNFQLYELMRRKVNFHLNTAYLTNRLTNQSLAQCAKTDRKEPDRKNGT